MAWTFIGTTKAPPKPNRIESDGFENHWYFASSEESEVNNIVYSGFATNLATIA